MSKIVAVIGSSQTGKTRLIERLVPELKKRGRTVAVIKHCPHGFLFDVKGKDSHRFFQAGADGVAMAGPDLTAVVKRPSDANDLRAIARAYFRDADIVLIEGGKGITGFRNIEILHKGISDEPAGAPSDLAALVTDFAFKSDKPVLDLENIPAVADFVEKNIPDEDDDVVLEVDGTLIPIKDFVRSFLKNTILGMIGSLRGVEQGSRRIQISILRREEEDEKL